MQTHHPRLNTYHSAKQRVLGNQGAHPAPAWRANARSASGSANAIGSKILLSQLPPDVVESEVETLFARTVGPVKEVFMVYNSQGHSRGMAVVSFARPGDAAVARAKYNGKIVDGRRPIRIEIVIDDDAPALTAPAPKEPSLLDRLAPAAPQPIQHSVPAPPNPQNRGGLAARVGPALGRVNLRAKKGPRRLNKQGQGRALAHQQQGEQAGRQKPKPKPKPKTREELDQEMEDYRAGGDERDVKAL